MRWGATFVRWHDCASVLQMSCGVTTFTTHKKELRVVDLKTALLSEPATNMRGIPTPLEVMAIFSTDFRGGTDSFKGRNGAVKKIFIFFVLYTVYILHSLLFLL